MPELSISIPESLAERLRRMGVDIDAYIVELIIRELRLDPRSEAETHLELSRRFLREASDFLTRDPVQASEKLYKAAEEAVKALAVAMNLQDLINTARQRGGWTVTELDKALREASKVLGEDFRRWWDTAWALHVWGFHEAKLDLEAVNSRLKDIENIVKTVEDFISRQK